MFNDAPISHSSRHSAKLNRQNYHRRPAILFSSKCHPIFLATYGHAGIFAIAAGARSNRMVRLTALGKVVK
jgi:hypothetical protein